MKHILFIISTLVGTSATADNIDKTKAVLVKGFNFEKLETRNGSEYGSINKSSIATPPFSTGLPDEQGFLLVPLNNGEKVWVHGNDLQIHRMDLEGMVCPKAMAKGKIDIANHSTRGLGGCKAN